MIHEDSEWDDQYLRRLSAAFEDTGHHVTVDVVGISSLNELVIRSYGHAGTGGK